MKTKYQNNIKNNTGFCDLDIDEKFTSTVNDLKKDRYKNFSEMTKDQTEGKEFFVRHKYLTKKCAVIAPHGGWIEPGTSEIVDRISNGNLSYYIFDGLNAKNNKDLHITSKNFDDDRCLELLNRVNKAVTIHGENGDGDFIYIGGLDFALSRIIYNNLSKIGFKVFDHIDKRFLATSVDNICNKSILKIGVQIEISKGIRKKFFKNLFESKRIPTEKMDLFCKAIIDSIEEDYTLNGDSHSNENEMEGLDE